MESIWFELNGERFHALARGAADAPPMLMLHGFPEYSGAWAELAPLMTGYRVIAPDQRGYGRSPRPSDINAYKTGRLVADMAALIEKIGRPVVLVGHDWGASVAYALAIRRPDLVTRLVILNGAHPIPFQRALAMWGPQAQASQYIHALRAAGSEDRFAADDFARLLRLFSANMDLSWLTADRLHAYRAAWGDAAGLGAMINWYRASPLMVPLPDQDLPTLPDFDADALRVRVPHLLIWGANDTALLPDCHAGLADLCDDLTLKTIDGADHWLHHQKPQEIAEIMLGWL